MTKRKWKKLRRKVRNFFLYITVRCVISIAGFLPRMAVFRLFESLGKLSYYLLTRERKKTLQNLSTAYAGEKTADELKKIAQGVFMNMGRTLGELAVWQRFTNENLHHFITLEGKEKIDKARSRGKGIILFTAHLGNWELLPFFIIASGYAGGVIAREIRIPWFDKLIVKMRESKRYDVFYRDSSPRRIIKTLKQNNIVGILIDQDIKKLDGVFVDFFGRPAYTPTAPVILAQKTGASLLPGFIVRDGAHHRVVIEDPVELSATGDEEKDTLHTVQHCTQIIEKYVRRYPEQWVWMHRRWRTQKTQ